MKRYSCGFVFDNTATHVWLVRKNHGPQVVVNRLNGIGGALRESETAIGAMRREFLEETGIDIEPAVWGDPFLQLTFQYGVQVSFFRCHRNLMLPDHNDVGEEHVRVRLLDIGHLSVVPNLSWILPLAADREVRFADVMAQ